jgi:hypothetical protein
MNKQELIDFVREMRELYPFLEVNPTSLKYWYDAYHTRSVSDMKGALKRWTTHGKGTPTIEGIKTMLDALGKNAFQGNQRKGGSFQLPDGYELAPEPEKDIDYVMRILGVQRVTREICNLVNLPPSGPTVFKLLSRADWIPAYKKLLDDLVAEAVTTETGTGPVPF